MVALNENSLTKLVTIEGIDATVEAVTPLYNVPAGKKLIVDHVVIRVTEYVAGAEYAETVISVGSNSPDFNNFINGQSLDAEEADIYLKLLGNYGFLCIHDSLSVLSLNIETASDATTEIWSVDVFGYLVEV